MKQMNEGLGKRTLTPLWIIALFLSLTETTLGIATTQTDGGIQVALTTFVIMFPTVIAVLFFVILWFKPYVLYAPTDYGSDVDVTSFVSAIASGNRPDKLYHEIVAVLKENISSRDTVNKIQETASSNSTRDLGDELARVLDMAVEKSVERIKDVGFFTVDCRPITKNDNDMLEIPYEIFSNVSQFLDNLWIFINTRKSLPTRAYGSIWVLRDKSSGKDLSEMGRTWAKQRGMNLDTRSLSAVGIKAGFVYEARYLSDDKNV